MARGKRKLEVVISGDSRSLENAFRRSGRASQSFGRKLAGGAGKALKGLAVGTAVAAAAAGAGFAVVMRDSIKAASDYGESLSKTQVVFKKYSKDVIKFSDKSATSLGISSTAALESAATYGNLFQAFGVGAKDSAEMSTSLVQLAADMASFNNTSVEDALEALRSGLSGESEPLKRFGIAINEARIKQEAMRMGLIETGEELSLAAKTQAIYGLVMKDSALAQGDFARTSDGLANQQRILSAQFDDTKVAIGNAFLPLLTEILPMVSNVMPDLRRIMEDFSKDVAKALKTAIDWVRANWPQIKTVITTVFNAVKFTVQNILVPAIKGIIAVVRTVVDFFRTNMPTIRRTTQDAFGWIDKHVVPTMRVVGKAVTDTVDLMMRVWNRHGDTIKRVVGVAYNTIRDIIKGGLLIIKGLVEANLALLRGDWSAVFDGLKTIVRGAFIGVTSVIRNVHGALLEAAISAGSRVIDGVLNGIRNGYGRLKSAIEQQLREIIKNLNPFSPVEHGGAIIADRLTNGFIQRVTKNRTKWARGLNETMRAAVQSARGNLASLTSTLSSMLGEIFGRTYRNANNKTLSEMQSAYDQMMREREQSRLEADKAEAESEVARLEAITDRTEEQEQELTDARQRLSDSILALSDWQMQEEIRLAQEAIDAKAQQYEDDIANLTASFNDGQISAEQFRDSLSALIGGATGSELGYAFASEFGAQVQAVADQIAALVGMAAGVAGPGVEDPDFERRMEQWRNRKKQLEDALADARKDARSKDGPDGVKVNAAEQKRINRAKGRLQQHNKKKPKRMADGGILRRAVLAGEAGPEAVLPLGSGRARRILADALDAAEGVRGGGGATIVYVTVNGNEFSAAEFARKLAPELRRNVALTRST